MKEKPSHGELRQFPVIDNQLVIGGRPVSEWKTVAGRTPFYIYERASMTERVRTLRAQLPDRVSIHYAMKANPHPEVVRHMASLVDGLDVASGGELAVALDAGTLPHDISFAGPGKQPAELCAAIDAGITINLESFAELERAMQAADAIGKRPNLAVRVNPDFELKASGMKMTGGAKPFGVDAERVPELLARIGRLDAHFRGFHIFSGSQNLRPESLVEAQAQTFELAYRLADAAPGPVELLNIGGGFGIPYFPGERPLDLAPVSAPLAEHLATASRRLPEAEVVIELGRYLVGEAGAYVCEVLERKESRGQLFLVTNGGLHHHLAASGNFGQVIRKNYPVVIGNRVHGDATEIASVVGPLCTPLDILADKMELPRADHGDLVVVLQSGAYGYSASPHRFLSHPDAVELVV